MYNKKVVIGLSGGVDSAVAAHLLKKQGYEVYGLLLRVPHAICPEKDAKTVARQLSIPLYIADVEESFTKNVIDYFCKEYKRGATPNPCVMCNPLVKFKTMADYADRIGAKYIATGHYAGVKFQKKGASLIRDMKNDKDQSYMLHRLPQEILVRTLFPLFQMEKSEVRRIAAKAGISVAEKKDSQEICFVPNDDYRSFLSEQGILFKEGDFVDDNGKKLGTHKGIGEYTIGQRKHLGIVSEEPLYVSKIDSAKNRITLSGEESLFCTEIICEDMFFTNSKNYKGNLECTVKLRYSKEEECATLTLLRGKKFTVHFEAPVRAPAKGQFAVFYQNELVLGGGRIT